MAVTGREPWHRGMRRPHKKTRRIRRGEEGEGGSSRPPGWGRKRQLSVKRLTFTRLPLRYLDRGYRFSAGRGRGTKNGARHARPHHRTLQAAGAFRADRRDGHALAFWQTAGIFIRSSPRKRGPSSLNGLDSRIGVRKHAVLRTAMRGNERSRVG